MAWLLEKYAQQPSGRTFADFTESQKSGGPSNYSLKSKANGNYVGAQDVNATPPFVLLADANNGIGPWERFRLVDCPNGSCR